MRDPINNLDFDVEADAPAFHDGWPVSTLNRGNKMYTIHIHQFDETQSSRFCKYCNDTGTYLYGCRDLVCECDAGREVSEVTGLKIGEQLHSKIDLLKDIRSLSHGTIAGMLETTSAEVVECFQTAWYAWALAYPSPDVDWKKSFERFSAL